MKITMGNMVEALYVLREEINFYNSPLENIIL